MNQIVSKAAVAFCAILLAGGIWIAASSGNIELLIFILLTLALFLFWIWKRLNIIIDERLVAIYEKTSVRTLETSVLILLLFSLFILSIGYYAGASNLLVWGYALMQNIVLIMAIYILFWLYYSRKYGVTGDE
ncbi:DUF2178 domain-containing protein [Methanocalculus taiwanensis]|uniref:DUF2178 domain-containing protein n=1 Tax=Methanocalculus taiwanensis TaxID=106207 RepID=A0ABD4TKV0_9EURY|nr:DUF2178 domain-containing protein [Methanocalculus taiwanensis]MCQ1537905.1 DUF2178 domain-containing protein [Methanocalculus taiwanensis]